MPFRKADQLTFNTGDGQILSVSVNCVNKIEFSFGANYVGFCSDSHIFDSYMHKLTIQVCTMQGHHRQEIPGGAPHTPKIPGTQDPKIIWTPDITYIIDTQDTKDIKEKRISGTLETTQTLKVQSTKTRDTMDITGARNIREIIHSRHVMHGRIQEHQATPCSNS